MEKLNIEITPQAREKMKKLSDRKHFAMDRLEYEEKRDVYIAEAAQKVLREFIGGIGIKSKDALMKILYEKMKEELSASLNGKELDHEEWPAEKIVEIINKHLDIGSLNYDLDQVILRLHKN